MFLCLLKKEAWPTELDTLRQNKLQTTTMALYGKCDNWYLRSEISFGCSSVASLCKGKEPH